VPSSCCLCYLCILTYAGKGIEGADEVIPLRIAGLNIPADVMAKYPHLYGSTHLEIDPQHMHKVGVTNITGTPCIAS
jgi:hypothetical protein